MQPAHHSDGSDKMRRSSMLPRSASRLAPPDHAIDLDELAETARRLAATLPPLAQQAEAGGLQLVAQHLNKALQLTQRIAAAGPAPRV